jgi:hypothetical protein
VTVSSGFNQDGMYAMTNGGRYNPSGVGMAHNVTPDGWIQRQILATTSTLKDIPALMASYRNDQGGVCAPSCIFVHAQASASLSSADAAAAMVYEGDRSNGVYRHSGDVNPYNKQSIMTTNYFFNYGFDPALPQLNFGQSIDFSSLWRYESGKNQLNAYEATQQPIGTQQMIELLRSVNEGTTEHSVYYTTLAHSVFYLNHCLLAGGISIDYCASRSIII